MGRVKVVQPCFISYGTTLKACINLRIGQIWEVFTIPGNGDPVYMIGRRGTTISIREKDFKRIFKEVKE